MRKYRKKPVVVEAVPVAEVLGCAAHDWENLPAPLKAAYETGEVMFLPRRVIIATLEGPMTASYDDYIIRGIKGELYPCKPDIFEATYEPVDED